MIRTWRITPTQTINMDMVSASLDEVTRQLPEGFYSTFRTFNGGRRVLGLSSHLQRLYGPVPAPDVDEPRLRRELFSLLEPYRPGEARVRAIMTKQGQTFLAMEPLKPLPHEVYEHGVTVETIELQRERPRLKSTGFIGRSDSERRHIANEGIFEALLVKDGNLLEGMTSNFFYVNYPRASSASRRARLSAQREVILGTARDDILLGITRETVIDIARGRGLEVKYAPLKQDQISRIQEAFITSSSRGIVPVVKINDVTIGEGRPGRITQDLASAYEAYLIEKAETIL
jgi:branched-chain amino acid aminotransferase